MAADTVKIQDVSYVVWAFTANFAGASLADPP